MSSNYVMSWNMCNDLSAMLLCRSTKILAHFTSISSLILLGRALTEVDCPVFRHVQSLYYPGPRRTVIALADDLVGLVQNDRLVGVNPDVEENPVLLERVHLNHWSRGTVGDGVEN